MVKSINKNLKDKITSITPNLNTTIITLLNRSPLKRRLKHFNIAGLQNPETKRRMLT